MKILYVGDSPTVDTGFGIVSRNLTTRLAKLGHEIVVLGINHFGNPYDPIEFPFPIYPVDKGSSDNLYGYYKFWTIYDTIKPDVVFILNDPWIIHEYINRKPPNHEGLKCKTIGYYPTDAGPIKKEWMEMLNELDAQVCYSNYAEGVVIQSNGGKRPKNLYQVYHGVDTKTFRPINQSVARAMMSLDPNQFIVGMVARNQYRKRFDLLMKAFSIFCRDKPEARLYLHTSAVDIGFDIGDIIDQLDLEGKVFMTKGLRPDKGVPAKELNVIYNSFDVNCLISLGDGFGLPVAESMATGCPQLVSDHSCLKELVEGNGGFTAKTSSWIMNTSGINTWGGVTDVDDIVDKLNILYKSKELRIKLSEDGYKFIMQEKFTWDYAVNEFDKIMKNLFHLI